MPRINSKISPTNKSHPAEKVVKNMTSASASTLAPSSPSFMNTVKEGFSFGIGSAVARNVVDRIMSPSSVSGPSETLVSKKEKCFDEKELFNKCIIDAENNWECFSYQQAYANCMKNSLS